MRISTERSTASSRKIVLDNQSHIIMASLIQIRILLGFIGLISIGAVSSVPVKARVVCYWGNWNAGSEGSIPVDKCTHVIYSFIGLNTNSWTATVASPSGVTNFLNIRNRNPNVKLIVAVGGGSAGSTLYSDMASVASRRTSFINSLVGVMRQYSFDGLDMDWEYPGVAWSGGRPQDKVNFISFMRELRTAFNGAGRGWEVTTAVSVVPANIQDGYDLVQLCQLVDRIHLMTYDFHGRWENFVDVHSPLHPRPRDGTAQLNTKDGALSFNNGGCPRYKLIVGIPFYGYKYILQDAGQSQLGAPSNVAATAALPDGAALRYTAICALVNSGQYTRRWDDVGKVPYAVSGVNWIGYEDVKSIQLKMDFIKNEGYGGAMVWSIDQDDYQGTCGAVQPLTTTIHNAMKDYYAQM